MLPLFYALLIEKHLFLCQKHDKVYQRPDTAQPAGQQPQDTRTHLIRIEPVYACDSKKTNTAQNNNQSIFVTHLPLLINSFDYIIIQIMLISKFFNWLQPACLLI
jgi:hypothetical protein